MILTHSVLVGVYMVATFYEAGIHIAHHLIAMILIVCAQLFLSYKLQLLCCFVLNIEISTIFLSIKHMIKDKTIIIGPQGDMINNLIFVVTFIITRPIGLTIMILIYTPIIIKDSPEYSTYILITIWGLIFIQYYWTCLIALKIKHMLKQS